MTSTEQDASFADQLRELSDPDLMAEWARARLKVALTGAGQADYLDAREEYERRLGRAS